MAVGENRERVSREVYANVREIAKQSPKGEKVFRFTAFGRWGVTLGGERKDIIFEEKMDFGYFCCNFFMIIKYI